jgi:hypothetical protein
MVGTLLWRAIQAPSCAVTTSDTASESTETRDEAAQPSFRMAPPRFASPQKKLPESRFG